MYARDGYDYDGYKLRVEFPRGSGGGARGGGGRGSGGGRFGGGRGGPPTRRTNYRVVVSGGLKLLPIRGVDHEALMLFFNFFAGLPPSGSWQDLKDHMREAGDVCYADVFKDGTGAVEYMRYEDMKYALRKLDDSRFKSHEVS